MRIFLAIISSVITLPILAADADPSKVFGPNEKCPDSRLGPPKNLNGYFPFAVPATKESWNDRRTKLREQLLVANGLWPMPEKTPLNPVIHGKIERDGYTIEKVYFSSMPGHYVSGNLYRPSGKSEGKRPGVLTPHGHWPPEGPKGGRFYDAGEAKAKKEIEIGAEKTMENARYPLQARCVGLVRLGFVVFHYDMVGYADSQAIKHRTGFTDAESELRGQNFMGLQTWNGIRALDFLSSLPEVDPQRIAMTGSSGGGTQTFILDAIDDRIQCAFPAVMVGTAMQGGCVCENCSYLRVGTGNVEIAAMFAPKPMALSAANDWTKDIETKGLPELKKLYGLYGEENMVAGKAWLEFGHNYNQVAREYMYNWFNPHVFERKNIVKEEPFKPVTPTTDLSVFDDKHRRPKDELDAAGLRKYMTDAAERQMKSLEPKDAKSLNAYRQVIEDALRVMTDGGMPSIRDIQVVKQSEDVPLNADVEIRRFVLGRKPESQAIPVIRLRGKKPNGTIVVWAHPNGKSSLFEKGQLVPAAKAILDKNGTIVAPDVFQTGELMGDKPFPVDAKYAGFTYGYNRPVFAQRVHDLLTVVRYMHGHADTGKVQLVGWGQAGVWCAAVRALTDLEIVRTAIDMNQFRFENIKEVSDENLLPGSVKFGGLPAFLALCAPHEVLAHNHSGTGSGQLSKAAYDAARHKDKLTRSQNKMKDLEVVEWLMK